MLDRDDLMLRDALERDLNQILYGDNEMPGLAQGLRAVQTWEAYQRTIGQIEGIEMAMRKLDERVRQMNGEEPVQHGRFRRAN
jgi:hypothetical protein